MRIASAPMSGPKVKLSRTPPNPPKPAKCPEGCGRFTNNGSNAYVLGRPCLDCRHMTQQKREEKAQYPIDQCPHEKTDARGSSSSFRRTFCRQCQSFIDKMPMQEHQRRFG